jgi:hypothetical protein
VGAPNEESTWGDADPAGRPSTFTRPQAAAASELAAGTPSRAPHSTLGAWTTTIVLLAATLRAVATVASGPVLYAEAGHSTDGVRVGAALVYSGTFADGVGVLLLGFALLLCWWQAGAVSPARSRVHLVWLGVLAVFSVLGSLAVAAGEVAYYWGDRDRWAHVINMAGLSLAYAILGGVVLAGSVACWRMVASRSGRPARTRRPTGW